MPFFPIGSYLDWCQTLDLRTTEPVECHELQFWTNYPHWDTREFEEKKVKHHSPVHIVFFFFSLGQVEKGSIRALDNK